MAAAGSDVSAFADASLEPRITRGEERRGEWLPFPVYLSSR